MMKLKKGRFGGLIYPDKMFYLEVFMLAMPVALQGLITIGVNVADTLMIGTLGERQLSAASLATQYVNMFHGFCMGLSMGASVLASRFWGMKDLPSLKKTINIMFRVCLIIALFFASTTWLMPELIMKMYTTEADVIAYGMEYLKYCGASYFFYGLSLTTTIILRSIKKVKIALVASILAFLVNVLLNYVLMFGKMGFPPMGVGGAALATLIVRIMEFIIVCGYLIAAESVLKFRIRDLFMKSGDLLPEFIRIGLPVLISDVVLALGTNVSMMIIGRLGTAYVAANAITAIVERFSATFIAGVSQGSAVITGNSLGKGEVERVKLQGWAFLGIGIGLGVIAAILILAITEPIIHMYHLTEETAGVIRQLLYGMSLITVFTSANHILMKGVLRGGGDTKALMFADNIFLWIVSIPFGFLAGLVLHLPAFWIYICLKIENPLKTIWCIYRLKSEKWIKKIGV